MNSAEAVHQQLGRPEGSRRQEIVLLDQLSSTPDVLR